MRPFLIVWALEISGSPKRGTAESMQKLMPKNLRNSLFVISLCTSHPFDKIRKEFRGG
jgi:hypothetical protein